jgi:hypothetical protein
MPTVQTFVGGTSRALPFGRHANFGISGKVFEMRDELDSRMWLAHHDQFSAWAGNAAAFVRDGLYRLAGWDGSVHQLLALAAAFALTTLSLSFTSSGAA